MHLLQAPAYSKSTTDKPWHSAGNCVALSFTCFFRWAIPGLFFFIFMYSLIELEGKILSMSGFEPQMSGVGSNRTTNGAAKEKRGQPLWWDIAD